MANEVSVEALRDALDEVRRTIALDRWVIGGMCAVGAWLIYLMTSQLGEFRATLGGVSSAMLQVQLAAERMAVQVESLDRGGGGALREHERLPRSMAHPKE